MAEDFPSYLKSIQDQLKTTGQISTSSSDVKPSTTDLSVTEKKHSLLEEYANTSNITDLSESQKKNSLRFLLVSTHCQQFTGYSRVSQNIIREVNKVPGVSIIHYGFQKHPVAPPNYRPYPSNVDVIEAHLTENPPGSQQGFGFSGLPEVIRKKKPHVIMIYNDMSVIAKFLEELRKSGIPRTYKLWLYVDQVYNCQMQGFIDIINRDADRVFAFTPYWKKILKDQGVNRPLDVILHGFDNKLYFPLPREMVRKKLGLPEEIFIYLSLNRNQPRKRLDILVMAFVDLIVKNPTKQLFLMCVCDKGEKGGWWIFEIFKRELELRKVNFNQYSNRLLITSNEMNFTDEEINLFYNVADIGVSTAEGEGWGLCNFEQMGVGVPQVVPDMMGFKEFCSSDNSIMVKPKMRGYLPLLESPVGGEYEVCDYRDISNAMEEYAMDSKKREALGKAAREKVLTYTWERACEKLVKHLKDLKKELEEDNELD